MNKWSPLSYLEVLRPDPGWRTEYAVLATYSVDLTALAVALLALAGSADDEGSGTRIELVDAIESLRNRVRLLVQRGRVIAPSHKLNILGILDQFIKHQRYDERENSWHPKAALLKQVPDDGTDRSEWRLWIGSRNLTRDTSWDTGLSLISAKGGKAIPGVAELGRRLFEAAELPVAKLGRIAGELKQLRWRMPEGCEVEEITLHEGVGRALPEPPKALKRLVVVSPFIDARVLSELGRWGVEEQRYLVSTRPSFQKLNDRSVLAGFSCLCFDVPSDGTEAIESSDELETTPLGLHAKMVWAEHGRGRTLWIGSANATSRGWHGPNAEIIARLRPSKTLVDGFEAFVKLAIPLADKDLDALVEDPRERMLELARGQVVSQWKVRQKLSAGALLLEAPTLPHPDNPEIDLAVAALVGAPVSWPRGQASMQLPPIENWQRSELIRCEISVGQDADRMAITWLQETPVEPAPDQERDAQALQQYLGARAYLAWLRQLLTGSTSGTGGGVWDGDPPGKTSTMPHRLAATWWAPTLEEVLKAWVRDPDTVVDVDRKLQHYLLRTSGDDASLSADERRVLDDLKDTWSVVRAQLIRGRR